MHVSMQSFSMVAPAIVWSSLDTCIHSNLKSLSVVLVEKYLAGSHPNLATDSLNKPGPFK